MSEYSIHTIRSGESTECTLVFRNGTIIADCKFKEDAYRIAFALTYMEGKTPKKPEIDVKVSGCWTKVDGTIVRVTMIADIYRDTGLLWYPDLSKLQSVMREHLQKEYVNGPCP